MFLNVCLYACVTIRKGSENFFYTRGSLCSSCDSLEQTRIHGATVTAKKGGKAFRLRNYVSLSVSLPVSVFVLSPLTPPSPPPLSLSLSLTLLLSLSLTLSVTVVTVAFSSSISLLLSLSISLKLALSLNLFLSEACSLAHSLSLCMSLSDSLSLCNYRFLWLEEMGSTRQASTPLLATETYLPRFACQSLSGVSGQRDWYYRPA